MAMDAAFVISGGLLLIFALVTKAEIASGPTADKVARDLLFDMCPLNGESAHFMKYGERGEEVLIQEQLPSGTQLWSSSHSS